jgi:cytidylate kinase
MYRAVALSALRASVDRADHAALARVAAKARIELTGRGRGPILLDGEDVTEAIRSEEVSEAASVMSSVPAVRRALVEQQRAIGARESCVMEGRDIGTVVFPDAELKVFLVASLETRADRRLRQSSETERPVGREPREREAEGRLEEILELITERDARDSTRADSPLVMAADAIEIDTTAMTIEQQVGRVVDLAMERGATVEGGTDRARPE